MSYEIIFFIGPQGSGKGTQARILAERLGFFHWEMGAILRETAKQETELGRKLSSMLSSGVLLPDDFLLEISQSKLQDLPKSQGIIFDGLPRRLGQAEFLLSFLKEIGKTKLLTLFIDLPREESIARLLLRAEKEGRLDDTRDVIEFRLKQYEQDTLPVLDFLKENSIFVTVDGRPGVEIVTMQINHALKIDA